MTYSIPVHVILILVASFFALVYSFHVDRVAADVEKITCEAIGDNAQTLYNYSPEKYARLDRDHDGKVCE